MGVRVGLGVGKPRWIDYLVNSDINLILWWEITRVLVYDIFTCICIGKIIEMKYI